ncbi:Uncharacterised protein [Legionella busanensis]|uniref:Uncharacterized protein n=1 Tax=Legionella busanensis TaxID=190655 RepID=A0A378JJR2_9GAMM|nr:hypothetical protein [Legionella busanensis]STX50410.1 Uncharacterised protein [Legionella busanensis]
MNIHELLNKIAKTKEAFAEYTESKEPEFNLNLDKNLEGKYLAVVDSQFTPTHVEDYEKQIELLQHYYNELKQLPAQAKIVSNEGQLDLLITETLTEINKTIVSLHQEKRKLLTEEKQSQIRASFQQLQEARRLELIATVGETHCLEQYDSNVQRLSRQGIYRLEDIISDPNVIIDNKDKYASAVGILDLKVTHRKEFLLKAQEELVKYQQVFKENQGLYVSTSKVPKEQLKRYLESDTRSKSHNKWLDDYYSRAKSTEGSVWGWLTEQAKYRTTIFSTAEADEDWYSLAQLIDEKLSQIREELKVQLDGEAVTSVPENLANDNLYTIQQKYQTIKQLEKQEIAQLDQWNKENVPVIQKAIQARFFTQLANLSNQQAVVENKIYLVDNKYAEIIDKVNEQLQTIVNSMLTDSAQTPLDLDQAQKAIAAIDVESLLASSNHYRNPSCNTLEQEIAKQFTTLERIRNKDIADLTKKIINLPKELAQFKQVTQENLRTLNDQKLKLQETRGQLRKVIATLQSLTLIQLELTCLQKQVAALKVDDSQGKHKLFTQLAKVQSQIRELEIKELESLKHPISRAKLDEIKMLASVVNEAKTAHQERLLTDMDLSIYDLNNGARLLSIKSAAERSDFAKEIKEELDNLKETLQTSFNISDKREVQSKKTFIEKKIKDFEQLAVTVIPMLNDVETILRDYTQLLERATALEKDTQFVPRFELGRDISQLDKDTKSIIEKAKSLPKNMAYAEPLYERLTQIDTAQSQLAKIKQAWAEEANKDRIGFFNALTKEVEEGYLHLIDSYKTLPSFTPTKRFHENTERADFYISVLAFEKSILLEKLKAYQDKIPQSSNEENESINEVKDAYLRINEYKTALQDLLLTDLEASYKALSTKCRMYSLPSFKFYTKDKTKIAQEIQLFKKSSLFKAYQALAGISPASMERFNDYEKQLSSFVAPEKKDIPIFTRKAKEEVAHRYFRDESGAGIFDIYLERRHQAFWFKDFIGSMSACFLGVFGFQSEQDKRKEYIQNLKSAYQDYKADVTKYESLVTLIDDGIKQFKPRVEEGKAGYGQTLQSYLQGFKRTVETVYEQNTLAAEKLRLHV